MRATKGGLRWWEIAHTLPWGLIDELAICATREEYQRICERHAEQGVAPPPAPRELLVRDAPEGTDPDAFATTQRAQAGISSAWDKLGGGPR